MVEKRLAGEHGVLIVAKAREPMRDEIVECRFRIGTGDGKSEWRQRTEIIEIGFRPSP